MERSPLRSLGHPVRATVPDGGELPPASDSRAGGQTGRPPTEASTSTRAGGGPPGGSRAEPIALDMQSTVELLEQARQGNAAARDLVFQRCVTGLRRFAAGRLPPQCRGMNDTEDLVQDTVVGALRQLDRFEIRHEGALLAYLRQAVLNRIVDEVRKFNRRPHAVAIEGDHAADATSPLEAMIGRENVERYEAALARLRPRDREAIVMRLEQQASYEAMAEHFAMPTPNAARVAVKRALLRLAHEMARPGGPGEGSRAGARRAS